MRRVGALLVVVAVILPACAATGESVQEGVVVVATTTILGDIAANIAGDRARIEVLLPIDADPHDFRASARQVAVMESADLVVANGLGLEEGLVDILDSLEGDGNPVLRVGEHLRWLPLMEGGGPDPHVWMDPLRMATAARLIGSEMERVAPGGGWERRGDEYAAELEALDLEISELLGGVNVEDTGGENPPGRVLVTNHETLAYFAERYRFEIVGVVIPGGSALAEPSSSHLADLVAMMRTTGVEAIFAETTEPTGLARAVADEVGSSVSVVELFIGSLGGPGSGAETYIDMMRTDAVLIAAGLA